MKSLSWTEFEAYKPILDLAPGPVLVVRAGGEIDWYNYAFQTFTEYRPRQIKAFEGYSDCLRFLGARGERLDLSECWTAGHAVTFGEVHGQVKGDRKIVVNLTAFPIESGAGRYDGALVFVQDMTPEWKMHQKFGDSLQVSEALGRVENLFGRLVDAMHDPMVLTDESGVITGSNRALTDLLKCSDGELHGRPVSDILQAPPGDASKNDGPLHEFDGRIERLMILRASAERSIPLSVSGSKLVDDQEQVFATMFVCRDLSETQRRMKAESTAESERDRARVQETARRRLEATQRQMMEGSQMWIDAQSALALVPRAIDPIDEVKKIADAILIKGQRGEADLNLAFRGLGWVRDKCEAAGRVLRESLATSRKHQAGRREILLTEPVNSAAALLENEFAEQKIQLKLETKRPTPKIRGSNFQVGQVALHLLRNAQDAVNRAAAIRKKEGRAYRKEIRVQIYASSSISAIEIVDNGIGIAPEIRERIFEPFFSTKSEEGAGNGLTISRAFIEAHDGKIEVSSAGEGTRVLVTFPRSDALAS